MHSPLVRRVRTAAAVLLATLLAAVVGVGSAPHAAAAPNGSITPVAHCFWSNGDGTWSVLLGYRSSNSGTTTEAIGSRNRFTQGAANRGQPTTFLPGTQDNVFAADITSSEMWSGIDWVVAGEGVDLSDTGWCNSKPVPADGNALAVLAFGALVTAAGSYLLSGRRRRRGIPETA